MTWPCCFHAPVWFGGIVKGSHVGMRDRVRWSTLPQTSAPVRTVLGRHAATQVSVSNLRKRGTSSEWRPGSQWSMRANEGQKQKVKLAVMVSGGGRSLENICARIADGQLTGCEIRVVLASKQSAGAIQKAERYGIPAQVLRQCDFDNNTEAFSDAISALLDEYGIDLVVLAGWMHFYLIPQRYEGKVLNIHPSLIPSFCGKGYYGNRVHEAVLKFGAKVTGCTVHFADNKYDHGPIILQKAVEVKDTDTVDELAARVFESEKEALPEAIQLFTDNRLAIEGRMIRIRSTTLST